MRLEQVSQAAPSYRCLRRVFAEGPPIYDDQRIASPYIPAHYTFFGKCNNTSLAYMYRSNYFLSPLM